MKDTIIRKWLGKALMPLGFLFLSACGGGDSSSVPFSSPTTSVNSTEDVSISSPVFLEGHSGSVTTEFVINTAVAGDYTYSVRELTAAAGSDFSADEGNITLVAGQEETLSVTVFSDTQIESDEIFMLELKDSTGQIAGQGIATITNDDFPSINIQGTNTIEGNDGTSTLDFTVSINQEVVNDFTINYRTAEIDATTGIAQAGVDYTALSGSLTFIAGETEKTIEIELIGDYVIEPDEIIILEVLDNEGNNLASSNAEIRNDDIPGLSLPAITIIDADIDEGDSATSEVTITVVLSSVNQHAFSINYTTVDNSASEQSDYTATSGTLNFDIGDFNKSFAISIAGDTDHEASETFFVELSNDQGVDLGSSSVTINNDDNPVISVSNISFSETNSGIYSAEFTIDMQDAVDEIVEVNYSTSNGTATTSNNDYSSTNGTVEFDPLETTRIVTVNVLGDTNHESDESFTLILESSDNVTLATAIATLINDDVVMPSSIAIQNTGQVEGNAGDSNILYLEALFGTTILSDFELDFKTEYNTADSTDFESTSGTVNISAGDTSFIIPVTLKGDNVYEDGEAFDIVVTDPNGSQSEVSESIDIPEDEQDGLSISSFDVYESDGTASFTIDAGALFTSTVTYTISEETASLTEDYSFPDGNDIGGNILEASVIFTNETSQTITIDIEDDLIPEDDETLTLTITNSTTPITFATASNTGTIRNDDIAKVSIQASETSLLENSGTTVSYSLDLDYAINQDITVNYSVSGSSGLDGSDYTLGSSSSVIQANSLTQGFTLDVNGDSTVELDETLTVTIDSIVTTGSAVIDGSNDSASFIIENDDKPTVSVSVATSADEDTAGTINFTLALDAAITDDVSIPFTFSGDATGGNDDYSTTASSPVVITGGTLNTTVAITVNSDSDIELDETVTLTLGAISNANGENNNDTFTIVNDDNPTVSVSVTASANEDIAGTINFTLALDAAITDDVSIPFTFSGDATGGNDDYSTAASSPVVITGGTLNTTVAITVNSDSDIELDETVTLTLGAISNANGENNNDTFTIINDDKPTVSVSVATSANEDTAGTINFTLALDGAITDDVSIPFTFSGDATGGNDDYSTAASSPVVITGGTLNTTVAIVVNSDSDIELDETVTLTLGAISNANGENNNDTFTIINDDKPTVSIDNNTINSQSEGSVSGSTDFDFYFRLDSSITDDVTVQFGVSGSTGLNASDYDTLPASPVTISGGSTFTKVTIPVLQDTDYERNEDLTLTLSNQSSNALLGTAIATISINNDDNPVVSISNSGSASIIEGASLTTAGPATFQVSIPAPATEQLEGTFTISGTGITAGDYETPVPNGTFTILNTASTGTISIGITGDDTPELDESLTVTLAGALTSGTGSASGNASVTIDNDDLPEVSITPLGGSDSILEDPVAHSFLLASSAAISDIITVTYSLAGDALVDTDYTNTGGQIAAGATSGNLVMTIIEDSDIELDESIVLTLTGANNATVHVTDKTDTMYITNDDQPTVSISSAASLTEGDSSSQNLTFNLNTDGAITDDITLSYSVTGDVDASDYGSLPSATISGEATAGSFIIPVNGDTTVELNEDLTVTLTSVSSSNALISGGSGAATTVIINNDQVSLNDTGITQCYDASTTAAACPVTSFTDQDGDNQTAFSFTQLDATGAPMVSAAYGTTAWSCVKDNNTGFIWEVKTPAGDATIYANDLLFSWYNTDFASNGTGDASGNGSDNAGCGETNCNTSEQITAVNADALCGMTNWRLPTPQELQSIVDYSLTSSMITDTTTTFPNLGTELRFWTSSANQESNVATDAVIIDFADGQIESLDKSTTVSVRLIHDP